MRAVAVASTTGRVARASSSTSSSSSASATTPRASARRARLGFIASLALGLVPDQDVARASTNDAVVAALRRRESSTGLARDVDEASRASALALAGDVEGARRALRQGRLAQARVDARARGGKTYDDVVAALDAFDDALRAREVGREGEGEIDAVRETSDALARALERANEP